MSDFPTEAMENAHDERKGAWREKYRGMTLHQLAEAQAQAKDQKEELESMLKDQNARFDVLRLELVPKKMEEDGIEKITIAGIGRISLTGDLNVSTPAGNKEALQQWLQENGLSDLIVPTVNAATLKATIKNLIKAGEPTPSEICVITPFTRASITKVKE